MRLSFIKNIFIKTWKFANGDCFVGKGYSFKQMMEMFSGTTLAIAV